MQTRTTNFSKYTQSHEMQSLALITQIVLSANPLIIQIVLSTDPLILQIVLSATLKQYKQELFIFRYEKYIYLYMNIEKGDAHI